MSKTIHNCQVRLTPENQDRLLNLCGRLNENLHQLEKAFDVKIYSRGHQFRVKGDHAENVDRVGKIISSLYDSAEKESLSQKNIEMAIIESERRPTDGSNHESTPIEDSKARQTEDDYTLKLGRVAIKPRTPNQKRYMDSIQSSGIGIGIGPAGTGKTYLAIAVAVSALLTRRVEKIILVRPAVEAGEKLGFLPGDIQQKIDPYLRPMFDALHEFLSVDETNRKLSRGKIEIASLAYMRGRTLSHSFVVMDEAQNATHNQMLMLLTRIGVETTMVINGDISQIDLPEGKSGLIEAMDILSDVKGVSITRFDDGDVMRSRLVRAIIQAYQKHDRTKDAGS